MEGDQLIGGKWNFDYDNCKFMLVDVQLFKFYIVELDEIIQVVMKFVENIFFDYMGKVMDFSYVVMCLQVFEVVKQFID